MTMTAVDARPFDPRPPDVPCVECGLPLDGRYAAEGHTRHILCERRTAREARP